MRSTARRRSAGIRRSAVQSRPWPRNSGPAQCSSGDQRRAALVGAVGLMTDGALWFRLRWSSADPHGGQSGRVFLRSAGILRVRGAVRRHQRSPGRPPGGLSVVVARGRGSDMRCLRGMAATGFSALPFNRLPANHSSKRRRSWGMATDRFAIGDPVDAPRDLFPGVSACEPSPAQEQVTDRRSGWAAGSCIGDHAVAAGLLGLVHGPVRPGDHGVDGFAR